MAKPEERTKKLRKIIREEIAHATGIQSVAESKDGTLQVQTDAGSLAVVIEPKSS